MSVQNNEIPTRPGGVTGRGFLPGQSGNPGGRPRGLSAAARAAVGEDGGEVIVFLSAIMRGDREALGLPHPVAPRDRLEAAKVLLDRGWGKAVTVVELPDAASDLFTAEQKAELRELPEDLKDGIRRWLQQRREAYFAERREESEVKMRSYLPDPVGADGAS